tara:strand:+ start:71 stop:463 length:393 start_codon:yes stop_codon:yes gene_type:complete
MAHLTFEYSKDLSDCFEIQELCDELSDAMRKTSYFPLGGIRVRGLAADVSSIADGKSKYSFVDMILRMGEGRSEDVRKNIADNIYTRAENFLKQKKIRNPIALSLELLEIQKEFSIKRYNTIHSALEEPK